MAVGQDPGHSHGSKRTTCAADVHRSLLLQRIQVPCMELIATTHGPTIIRGHKEEPDMPATSKVALVTGAGTGIKPSLLR
jgi:hypothetical protein